MRAILVFFILAACASMATAQSGVSANIARTAADICSRSQEGFRLQVGGELSAGARSAIAKRVLGADIELDGDVQFETWEGVQQVLREHQLAKEINETDCIRDLIPQLLEFELEYLKFKNQQSRIDGILNAPKRGEQTCIPVLGQESFPLPAYKDMCVANFDGTRLALVQRADSRIVRYFNAQGMDTKCYPGDPCSFGWQGSPIFSVVVQNGTPFLVSIQ